MFTRLRCHFCGTRQPHPKTTTYFLCGTCDAPNFFDGKGNVVDAPEAMTSSAHQVRPVSFARPPPEMLAPPQQKMFCNTCTQNQHITQQLLAQYLPDESHPQYQEFEKALPEYKNELEKRYPIICKRCAPLAQSRINRADYYGMTQNARHLVSATKRRNGQPARRTRDDWFKRGMRVVLNAVGFLLFLGLAEQMVYHAYAILNVISTAEPTGTSFDVGDDMSEDPTVVLNTSPGECIYKSFRLQFSTSCSQLLSRSVPSTLVAATIGLFYSPGLKAWYHHTHRMEAVKGQSNYFYMQLIAISIRSVAWYILSDPQAGQRYERDQLIAMHAFAIFFTLIAQAVATRGIQPVLWTMKGSIMPPPDEKDVLGVTAGPAETFHTFVPQSGEQDPWKYLRKQDSGPMDINMLAPQAAKAHTSPVRSQHGMQQPSPEYSDDDGDYDRMETDHRPVMRSAQSSFSSGMNSQPRNRFNGQSSIGFTDMTEEVFGMQTQLRQEDERRRQEQAQKLRYDPPSADQRSPFYGSLPPAPMSIERRLRNPVIRPIHAEPPPLSHQKNFLSQMQAGVKPVQFPEKGTNFELKKSEWVLPSDVKEVGLEERFSQKFSLADPSPGRRKETNGVLGFLGL